MVTEAVSGTKRAHLLTCCALAAAVCMQPPASGQDQMPQFPACFRYAFAGRKLVSGVWAYEFGLSGGGRIPMERRVTGFAFGPGRTEIAYCTGGDEKEQSALWVVAFSREDVLRRGVKDLAVRRRLLWRAPEGFMLRGPVWWAPDGARIAVRASARGVRDVAVVEYVTGEMQWLTEGNDVLDLAWSPSGNRVAYVAQTVSGRSVFAETWPPAGRKRLGTGGIDLRWSADGRSCAALVRPEGDGKPHLVIYPTGAREGETVPLPDLHAKELLGWTPDSNLLVVLGDMDVAFAVAARPPVDWLREAMPADAPSMPRDGVAPPEFSGERAAMFTLPIDAEAGPPTWFANIDMVTYVVAAEFDPAHPYAAMPDPDALFGDLVVSVLQRNYVGEPEAAHRGRVAANMKKIALAVQMYLADNDDTFPPATDTHQFRHSIEPYVPNESVFMRPGTEDEVVVEYLVPPGVSLAEAAETGLLVTEMPVAVVDYHPDWFVIAYGDGHVESFEKKGKHWRTWTAWWEEFHEQRGAR